MQGGVFEISGPYFLRAGVVFEQNSIPARKKYGFINNECIARVVYECQILESDSSRGFGCQIS